MLNAGNNNPQQLVNININHGRLTISPSNADHQIRVECNNININGGGEFILGSGSMLNGYVNDSGDNQVMGQVDVDAILHN